MDRQLESLRREFAEAIPETQVDAIGRAYFDTLRANARIPDFVPVLVYRYAREELLRRSEDLSRAA